MTETPDPIGESYESDIALAVVTAVVTARADHTGFGGVVDPPRAFDGICMAIAMIANNTGAYASPKERRALADTVRKHLTKALNAAADADASGKSDPWAKATPIRYSS